MFKATDPLVGQRGTLNEALAATRGMHREGDAASYSRELYRLALLPDVGLDFAILFAQFLVETDRGASPDWQRLDPAGLGRQNKHVFASGEDAARAHAIDMAYRVHGKVPDALRQYESLSPNLSLLQAMAYAKGRFRTVQDLEGTKNRTPGYAEAIAREANETFRDERFPPLPDHEQGILRVVGAPSGAIRTKSPWGSAFGVGWDRINRWDAIVTKASAEFNVPAERIKGHIVIESAGDASAVQKNPGNGDSYGLMQIVPHGVGWKGWAELVYRLAGKTGDAAAMLLDPELNVRVGAAILKDNQKRFTTWDRASSAYFLGNPDWKGADTVNGNSGPAYKASLDGLMAEISSGSDLKPEPAKPGGPVFGNTVKPPKFQLRIIQHNTAWDDAGPRVIKGVVLHRMEGTLWGTDSYFRNEASARALTDYGVGGDGTVLQWNLLSGRRSPWASGPWTGGQGDGPAWVAKFGVASINRDLASIELSGWADRPPVSREMFEATAQLIAYVCDQWGIPWTEQWPVNPNTGLVAVYWHREFTWPNKPCPGQVVMDATDAIVKRAGEIMKAAQYGTAAPAPPPPPVDWNALSDQEIADLFGSADGFGWNPNDSVCLMWLAYAAEQGRWPRLVKRTKTLYQFSDGLLIRDPEGDGDGLGPFVMKG